MMFKMILVISKMLLDHNYYTFSVAGSWTRPTQMSAKAEKCSQGKAKKNVCACLLKIAQKNVAGRHKQTQPPVDLRAGLYHI